MSTETLATDDASYKNHIALLEIFNLDILSPKEFFSTIGKCSHKEKRTFTKNMGNTINIITACKTCQHVFKQEKIKVKKK